MIRVVISFLLLSLNMVAFGQYLEEAGEIKKQIDQAPNDSVQISLLWKWEGLAYNHGISEDSAVIVRIIQKSQSAIAKDKTGQSAYFTASLARAYDYLGLVHMSNGDLDSAVSYHSKAKETYLENNLIKGLDGALINLGQAQQTLGLIEPALKNYELGLHYAKKNKNWSYSSNALNSLGMCNREINNYRVSLNYFYQAEELALQVGDSSTLSTVYNNTGNVFHDMAQYDSALYFYYKAIDVSHGDVLVSAVPDVYHNIGVIYLELNQLDSSKYYLDKGLELRSIRGSQYGLIYSYNGLSGYFERIGDGVNSVMYAKKAYDLAISMNAIDAMISASSVYYKALKIAGRSRKALEVYEEWVSLKDSLYNETNQKAIIRQKYKYDYEKQAAADSIKLAEFARVKDAQLAAEQAQNKQNKLAAKQQEQQKYFLFGGLGLALLFGGLVFNRYRATNKQKEVIEEQKRRVDSAYEELEEKNTEILDSINYAKRIQSAILPSDKLVKEYLSNSFVLYKPKDIVAGDFYWMEPFQSESQNENGVLFAAADCTGHGVPGAMVSVVCNNALNRSVREFGISNPGQILDKTREIVIAEFEKSEQDVKDGMDIVLCSLEGNMLKYAGAHNPLWIIRKDAQEVEEIKADKQPIGKYDEPLPYTTHTIELHEGDSFYIFSDGYTDQFGGEKGKKFKAANFKRLLLSIQSESLERQKELIDEAFENWKGDLEQLDDVCVIGVRV